MNNRGGLGWVSFPSSYQKNSFLNLFKIFIILKEIYFYKKLKGCNFITYFNKKIHNCYILNI